MNTIELISSAKNMPGKFSIIIPAFNEASRIAANIEEVARTLNSFGYDWQIIIFDDGSTDHTFEAAQGLLGRYPQQLIVQRHERNVGKGSSLKKAIAYADGEYIVFLDADLELHPGQIKDFYELLCLRDADVVIGSKQHPKSCVESPTTRKWMSFVYYEMVRFLFRLPCRDTQTGLKLFKAKALREVAPSLSVKRFAFDLELLVAIHRLGYKIVEAPVVVSIKRAKRRIPLTDILAIFWDTLMIWARVCLHKPPLPSRT